MSRDSQASFSQSARNAIRGKYHLRCVICLSHTPMVQCAHIIDAATPGHAQVCHKTIVYDLALVLLSSATQSNSAFCLKIIREVQQEMAYFVSGDHHSLQTLIDRISQSAQLALPISLRMFSPFLFQSLSWSTSMIISDILRRPAGNPYARCVVLLL